MDQTSPTPPPPLADEALGAVMQLAQAASRHENDLGESRSGSDDHGRHGKGRSRDINESGRQNKQLRMENEHGQGVDTQTLSWPTAPPPAYGTPHDPHGSGNQPSPYGAHGLDQNSMHLGHSDASFDPAAHGVGGYGDGVVDENSRMGPPSNPSDKHVTSESTGLVGARGKTGMTRTLSTSRRAEQNRNAQRVFRERKNKYIADLEAKAASLENALLAAEEHRRRFNDALETIEILKRDNDTLRVALRALGGHQAVPSAPALPMDRPSPHTPNLLSYGTPGGPGRGHQGEHDSQHNATGAPGPTGMHDAGDGQDPATAAAVAAAASGNAPYWLIEAVSNANQQHGFPVPNHFQASLGDNMGAAQTHNPMHRGTQAHGQRPEGMIDPSLEQSRLSGLSDDEQRHAHREENKDHLDSAGNPDNLASLSAVAAAAAAASNQKPSS
ncbi:hypothetical protein MYAM1_001839 [Malassezia yamatoensis]|uniref:BZIP domain-containing protein n=1 Tax=Malassezia yamatoensis TaxID=253288 RepID=A0AAJ6CIP4_9BASI|nr:hypothetical protein MYAM1_001839 [Malassezia yamatoensis]